MTLQIHQHLASATFGGDLSALSNSSFERANLYIESDLQLRLSNRAAPPELVDRFIERNYGMCGFTELAAQHFPCERGMPLAMLPRQIPIACTETITCALLCKALGVNLSLGSFGSDNFSFSSIDKSAAVKVRSLSWRTTAAGKSCCDISTNILTFEKLEALNKVRIDRLKTKAGESLLDHHGRMLKEIMPDVPIVDSSRFFHECLVRAKNRPEFCYTIDNQGRCERVEASRIEKLSDQGLVLRPPASWYYPLFFSLLLERMILLETYENPRGQVSEAKGLFVAASDRLLAETGYRPRIIRIPPLSKEMLYLNLHILEDGKGAMARLEESARASLNSGSNGREQSHELNTLECAHKLAQLVLEYGKV
ncbi:MAG: hypothetical protein DCC75_00955 [Proteobacteria bacterium]|nr:MAG: hypothetical protein DCC75_00955 [Pseudomonadota bacterium]